MVVQEKNNRSIHLLPKDRSLLEHKDKFCKISGITVAGLSHLIPKQYFPYIYLPEYLKPSMVLEIA
jgi:hypothetical protein